MKKDYSVSSKKLSTGSRRFAWAAAILGVFLACTPIPQLSAADCFTSSPGCLDPLFGAGTGKVTANPAGSGAQLGIYPTGAVVDSSGRLVSVGSSIIGSTQYLVMERFNNDGSVDTSFGTNGNGIVISSTTQWINAVALQQVSG